MRTGLRELLLDELEFTEAMRATTPAKKLHQSRLKILEFINETRKTGDLKTMIEVEKEILLNDLSEYSNSKMMESSLKEAIKEMQVILNHLDLVNNPDAYKAVNEAYALPKNRQKGLPLDEARQAFKSHFARLVNMDKSRLDVDEKEIVETRQSLVNEGQRLYINLQNKALGIELKSSRKLGL